MIALINDTGMLVVLVGIVMLFGASRIPKLARNLGEASKEFKNAQDEPVAAVAAVGPAPVVTDTVTISRDQLDRLLAAEAAAGSSSVSRPVS